MKKIVTRNKRHALEALIPEPWMAEDYVGRDVWGVKDVAVLDKAASLLHNVIIAGPTGSAKTSMVYAFAAGYVGETKRKRVDGEMKTVNVCNPEKRRPVVYIPCNGAITPEQLYGGWVPSSEGGYKFAPGDLLLAVIHGGILYFDEVNFLAIKIAAAVHGLTDKRRTIVVHDAKGAGLCNVCGYVNPSSAYHDQKRPEDPLFLCEACGEVNYTDTVFVANDDTLVVAAYNPGYRGTSPLNEAFLNRFGFKVPFPYLREVEDKLMYSSRLIDVADQLRAMYDAGEITVPVSTSMLMEFEQFALDDDLGFGFAVENFLSSFTDNTERRSVAAVLANNAAAIRGELIDEGEEEVDGEDAIAEDDEGGE